MAEEKNPFMVNMQVAKIKVVQCYSSSRFIAPESIVIDEGVALPKGEAFNSVGFEHSYFSDKAFKCSLYQSDSTNELIKKLDGNGRTMLIYVQCNLKRGADTIKLTVEDYENFCGLSSTKTFYSAINQLASGGVLQRKKSNTFWVNPFIIFNGNRVDKYPENVEVVAKIKLQ